jgi:undecaprenyl-diphosphatase
MISAYDQALFYLINGAWSPQLDLLMPFITNKWNFVVPTVIVSAYVAVRGGRPGRLMIAASIVLVLCADGSATVLRSLFHRTRPCHVLTGVRLLVGCTDSFSFPSNSAANVFALAVVVVFFYRKLAVPAFVAATLVGYSRVYVGVHYPLDVFGGALLGIGLGLAGAKIMRRAFLRSRPG